MRVLGVDPGSRYLGFGLIDARAGQVLHVASGVVCASGSLPLAERLQLIFVELQAVIAEFKPEAVAVEGVFSHKNARSALILGHARGVALLLAAQAGLSIFEYAPARVKRSVGAGGNDGKDAVARMVTLQLKLKAPLARADAYDALAVALCHWHHLRGGATVARPGGLSRQSPVDRFAGRLSPGYVAPRPSVES